MIQVIEIALVESIPMSDPQQFTQATNSLSPLLWVANPTGR